MKSNIIAVVQARMGSSRLKDKMLLDLHGTPIIEWVIKRTSLSKKIDDLIVTIPEGSDDDVLYYFLRKLDLKIYRGSELDVLDRFYSAAASFNPSHVVRICADNPLISPNEIDNLIDFYFSEKNCDYAYNHIPRKNLYPDGLGAEIVSFDVLDIIYRKAKSKEQREHIFNYIWDKEDQFIIKTFDPPNKKIREPDIKLDIDTIDDYELLQSKAISLNMNSEEIVSLFL